MLRDSEGEISQQPRRSLVGSIVRAVYPTCCTLNEYLTAVCPGLKIHAADDSDELIELLHHTLVATDSGVSSQYRWVNYISRPLSSCAPDVHTCEISLIMDIF